MSKHCCGSLLVLLLFSSLLYAQTGGTRPKVSTMIGVLTASLESKNATAGQEFTLKTISDVVVNGEMIIPRTSRVLGHVTEAVTKGKDQPQSELWIVIDKAVNKDGREISLQAIIAAIAAPQKDSLATDPTYGMMHSNEPTMSGGGAARAASTGGLGASSKASSTAAVATANLKGMDQPSSLDEESQGAIGYEGLSISWHLVVPPPITVLASKSKNVKLEAGTQMLLRMAPPALPR